MCHADNPSTITGVIDFGDLVKRPLVVDLATSLVSVIEHSPTPLHASAALVSGFSKHMPVPAEQLELLYDAILARAIMTVQLIDFRVRNTDVEASVGAEELPEAKFGLRKLLAIDPAEFLDFVYAKNQTAASPGD